MGGLLGVLLMGMMGNIMMVVVMMKNRGSQVMMMLVHSMRPRRGEMLMVVHVRGHVRPSRRKGWGGPHGGAGGGVTWNKCICISCTGPIRPVAGFVACRPRGGSSKGP